jgi:hypothetical protein
MTRECGPCSECCFSLAVHEIDKAVFTRCKHEKASKKGACSIYAKRPESCQTFNCIWLGGASSLLDRKDRPDRIGIVFATAEMVDRQVVIAYVRRPNADKSGRGKELIGKLAGFLPVCISRWDGTRSIALPEELGHLVPRLRAEFNTEGVIEDGVFKRRLPLVEETP